MSDCVRGTGNLFYYDQLPLTSPRQFMIHTIPVQMACALNEKWHSRLPRIDWSNVTRNSDYICFGAEYNGDWYAVAIWSSPVAQNRMKDGKEILELRRMAICKESPRNTASRMISVMEKHIKNTMPHIKKLISYQDTEVHHGTIYKASNWVKGVETKGVTWGKSRIRNPDQTTSDKIRWEKVIE